MQVGRYMSVSSYRWHIPAVVGLLITIQMVTIILHPSNSRASTACATGGPTSGAYRATICLTDPLAGDILVGEETVTASVTLSGSAPAIRSVVYTLDQRPLLADFEAPYTFDLPSARWIDGSHTLRAKVQFANGFVTPAASAGLTFRNGVTTPPTNTNTFTPTSGLTPAPGQPLVVAAVGDGASGRATSRAVTDRISSWSPHLFLYLGDVYDTGTLTEFRNWYGVNDLFGQFRAITNPAVGNHEYYSDRQATGYIDYWDNVPHFYSVDAGKWHMISLDTTTDFGQTAPGTGQYTWLAADLAASDAACTLVFMHHPRFSLGDHGDNPSLQDLWALLAEHGVDVVLTGHDHNYQRWVPLDGAGVPLEAGMTQFIVGTGGMNVYPFSRSDVRAAAGVDTAPDGFGALRLGLGDTGADYQYLTIDGVVRDSGHLDCSTHSSSTPPVVTAPVHTLTFTRLGVTNVPVKVTWSATDPVGINSYEVQLSTNGGPFKTIATRTASQPTSLSLQLAPGRRYQVRVRATNRDGVVGAWATGSPFDLATHQETDTTNITYSTSPTWTTRAIDGSYGGAVRSAVDHTASVTVRFTGTHVAWVATTCSDCGKAEIWIDGAKVAVRDLYSASTTPTTRVPVYVANNLLPGPHTMEIRVLSSRHTNSTGNRVDLDAVIILR